ncbi:hypothetical protein OHK33_01280 [Pectobacterium aroidearum]|uniref:hypothetical protein n=1 Tax=Pectobacterium aroidearum TaxID=1201031 RepID=UPI0033078F20
MEPLSALALLKEGSSSLKSAIDVVSSIKSLIQKDKKASEEFDKLHIQLYEAREKLFTAQERLQNMQSEVYSLKNKATSLEEEIVQLKKQRSGFESYFFNEIAPGRFVYTVTPSETETTPLHHICASCKEKNIKSILQLETQGSFEWLICHQCDSKIEIKKPKGGVWEF